MVVWTATRGKAGGLDDGSFVDSGRATSWGTNCSGSESVSIAAREASVGVKTCWVRGSSSKVRAGWAPAGARRGLRRRMLTYATKPPNASRTAKRTHPPEMTKFVKPPQKPV